jgi:hypothetical protein
MNNQDPTRPVRPEPNPLPPMLPVSNPSRYGETDRVANTGYILAALGALLIVVVLIMWAGPTDQQTANNPPSTTAQGGQVPPRIAR